MRTEKLFYHDGGNGSFSAFSPDTKNVYRFNTRSGRCSCRTLDSLTLCPHMRVGLRYERLRTRRAQQASALG